MSSEIADGAEFANASSELAAAGQAVLEKVAESKGSEVVCRDFVKGKCDRGSACKFSHSENIVSKSEEQAVCRDFLKGRCDRGIACKFSHPAGRSSGSVDDPATQKVESAVCRDYLKGTCTRGAACKFNHPEDVQARVRNNIVTCQDFQTKKCDRDPCRYLHITKKEESLYRDLGIGNKPDNICHDHLKGNCARGQTCRFHHFSVEELSADGVCRDYLKKNCIRSSRCRYRHVSDKEYALEKQFLELTGMTLSDAVRYGFHAAIPPMPRPPLVPGPDIDSGSRGLKRPHDDDSVAEENKRLRRKVNELQSQLLDLRTDNTELQRQILKLRESNEELTEHLERLRGQAAAVAAAATGAAPAFGVP